MAKDDFHVIVYQILSYLYQCLKKGVDIDTKMLSANSPYFIVHGSPLSDRYWCYILWQMQSMGLIEGIMFSEKIDNLPFERPMRWNNCMITPKGIDYLTDNSFIQRAKRFLEDVNSIVPFP